MFSNKLAETLPYKVATPLKMDYSAAEIQSALANVHACAQALRQAQSQIPSFVNAR